MCGTLLRVLAIALFNDAVMSLIGASDTLPLYGTSIPNHSDATATADLKAQTTERRRFTHIPWDGWEGIGRDSKDGPDQTIGVWRRWKRASSGSGGSSGGWQAAESGGEDEDSGQRSSEDTVQDCLG
jgi:hypothetical protein